MRHAVLLRRIVWRAILDARTLAGNRVEMERIDGVASGDMPRVIVYGHENLDGTSKGGTAPRFTESLTLELQCLVEEAVAADAVDRLDELIDQTMNAVLSAPEFTMRINGIDSGMILRKFNKEQERVIGDGRITLVCSWFKTYAPRLGPPLSTITTTMQPGPDGTQPVVTRTDFPPPQET